MQFIGLIVSLIGGILDPLTLCTSIIIGILSPSRYWAGGLGFIGGLALAVMAASISTSLDRHYPLFDGWLMQICNVLFLSIGIYFLNRGWKKLGRVQREMDDNQIYLSEMQNPSTIAMSDDETQEDTAKVQISQKVTDANKSTKNVEIGRPFQLYQWLTLLSITLNITLIIFCFVMYKKLESIELQTSILLDSSSLESIETKLADIQQKLDELVEESRDTRRTSERITMPSPWAGGY